MKQYLDTARNIMTNGTLQDNRTSDPAVTIPGMMMRYDLQEGFPAVTTKKLPFKAVLGELCAFLRASDSAEDFRALGCKVWDANANDPGTPEKPNRWLSNPFRKGEDDLGPVYGVQWRRWQGHKVLSVEKQAELIEHCGKNGWIEMMRGLFRGHGGEHVLLMKEIDQLGDCVRSIMQNPTDRRILFHSWNPAVLDEVALPACHLLYQFHVNVTHNELSLTQYIRSNDIGLGSPFNIAEAAALLALVARLTGRKARWLSVMIGDAHIYHSHEPAMFEQCQREPLPLAQLDFDKRVPFGCVSVEEAIVWLDKIEPSDFILNDYQTHGPLSHEMKMAV